MHKSIHLDSPIFSQVNTSQSLEKQSHIFIVILGSILGTIFSAFIAYHISYSFINFLFLMIIPILVSYFLRKVYIHTLVHYQE